MNIGINESEQKQKTEHFRLVHFQLATDHIVCFHTHQSLTISSVINAFFFAARFELQLFKWSLVVFGLFRRRHKIQIENGEISIASRF
jgi:hypothetical protein